MNIDEDVYTIATEFRNVINVLLERVKALEDRTAELDEVLFDDILNPAKAAMDNANFESFKSRTSEKLGPLENDVRAIEGEDFDLYRTAMDSFKESDIEDEAEFIDEFAKSISSQVAELKEKLGVGKVEVAVDEANNVEVKADGETIDTDTAETAETAVEETTPTEEEGSSPAEEDEEIDYSKYYKKGE